MGHGQQDGPPGLGGGFTVEETTPLTSASVTGRGLSIPFFTRETSVRRGRASVRGRRAGRHLMGFERIGRPISRARGRVPRAKLRSDLIHRPGVGTSLGKAGVITRPKRFKSLLLYGEVGKAALMAWRASLLGRDGAVRAPKPRSGAHLRGA